MNVKELKALIEGLPDEMEVILQKDSEGNSYSPLAGGDDKSIYIPECPWYGDVYSTEWTAEDACMSEEEWSLMKTQPRVLILLPTN